MGNEDEKRYWIPTKRFYIILVVLFIFWLGIMTLFYLKADEVTKNPCQICAKKIGTDVICTATMDDATIIFHPNYSTEIARTYILP